MTRLLGWILSLTLLASMSFAQDAPAPPASITVPDLTSRLAALDPERPSDYFDLAEEIAFEIRDERGRALAQRLFVLAYELSREQSDAPQMTRSVCLALASLENSGSERRRWLLALASLQSNDAPSAAMSDDTIDARETVAIALSSFKAQDNLKARIQLGRPNAARYIASLDGDRKRVMDTVLSEIETEANCPVCRNRRIVRDRDSSDPSAPDVLCTRCSGNPGPRLGETMYLDLLLFEIEMLGVDAPTWSAQLDLDEGQPLREADPDQLAALYGIDAGATTFRPSDSGGWRDGAWVEPVQDVEESDDAAPRVTQPAS